MNPPVTHPASRREWLIFLYKYRVRLLLSFGIPFAAALVMSTLPVPRYKAESVLIVRLGSEYLYQPEGAANQNRPVNPIPFNQEQIFKSEVAILESGDLHRQVVEAMGIARLYPAILRPSQVQRIFGAPPPDELRRRQLSGALEAFNRHFDILLEKESAVITVSFEHPEAKLATEALETLLRLYFEKRKRLYLEPRAELAQAEVQRHRDQALAAAARVEAYKRQHRIYSLDTQRGQLLDKRGKLQEKSTAISSPVIEAKIAQLNQQLDRLDAEERELGTLQKEAEIADQSYSLYSHTFDEAQSFEEFERKRADSVRVIQPPLAPSEPRKLQPLIIELGAIVSLIIMSLTAAWTEFARIGFLTPEQIERRLGLPVLAVFPESADIR